MDLGLLDDEPVDKQGSPLDTLSTYLSRKLIYEPGERDIIIMRHDVFVEWPDKKEEIRHLDFVCYGTTRFSETTPVSLAGAAAPF